MHRRDLLALLGAGAAGSLLAPLSAEERYALGRALHRDLADAAASAPSALVARIADLILPTTDTPGALDVRVPEFVDAMMTSWYSSEERADFERGLAAIEERAGSGGFLALTDSAQIELLRQLDGTRGPKGSAEAAFATLKWLTVYGYFTSERVQKEVLKTVIIPGRFDGCIPVSGV
jgi:hypothetical protein